MNWFQQSTFRINDQIYHVPALARWAKENLPVTQLSIADIQNRYVWADKLFVDSDDPEDEWSARSMGTDLSYPILMLVYPDSKWEIVDGNHRVWKAWKTGLNAVSAYLILSDKMPSP